ncbi:MAG: SMI1/KNR4 family protein, partial [Actinobacteria bacterium]|nr:SMI1/KNR4 family protein [Actinomycetota bacterium]
MLPDSLPALCGDGVELVGLEEPRIPRGLLGDPNPEFGVLGADMTTYFDEDDSAEAMPGAWPPALDGGGG